MATIVKHNTTGKNYCLLGTGFGVFQSSKPNMFFGNLMADVDEGNTPWSASVIVLEKYTG
ncbi:MAG: hypothetical protein OXM61_08790 [Candidatus Poribacteria bacterium]|nr:hypothetical protein [Candidatus Poribacteria bacterium]